ncbi:MAG: hypothetical protein KC652_24460, partial [Cyanobacteria bacterium HKST-UBA01]|nr:hypothetical protein [Cyanobacteria bacterium HKST-UBA01]
GVEINVDGGMTSGNGGVIELLADGGTLDVDGTATGVKVSAKAPMDGNGGLVVFDGIGTLNIDSGNIDVSAAGNNGQGGNLFVLNNQDTNFTSGEIFANGAGNGKGGTVFIDSSNDVTLDASTINANGGDDNSDGGSITINADKLTAQNGLNIFANAGIEGNGGDISITANGNTDLDLTDAVIDASSGLSGNGGDVTITAYQVLVNGTTIRANGQDTGTGGEIDIVLMGVNQAVDLNQALAIQAMGGENGFGGTLSVTDFVPMNDPEAIINVYAETSSVAAVARPTTPQAGPTGTGGVIKVTKKGITCQFYPAADKTKWPKGYWNCAHPGGATVEDLAAINIALSLSDADRAILKSYSIYVWKNVSDFQSFTGNPPTDPNEAGETSPVSAGRGYLSVFESTPVYPTLTETQIKESAAHELGHANDHVLNESEGTGSSHSAFVLHDFQALDYDDVQTTAQLSHLRPPCTTSTFDGKPGPLVGVVDQSTQLPFCDGSGNIETKYRDPNNGGAPYRNSYILRTAAAYFYGDNVELYAHQFAWAAYVSSLTDRTKYFIYTVDGVNANNQFACTISWAQAVKAGMTRPPTSPAGCGTFKSWYPAVLGTKTSHD